MKPVAIATLTALALATGSTLAQVNLLANPDFEDLNCDDECLGGSLEDLQDYMTIMVANDEEYQVSNENWTCPWKLWAAPWAASNITWDFTAAGNGGGRGLLMGTTNVPPEASIAGSFGVYQEFTVVYNGNPVQVFWDWRAARVGGDPDAEWWEVLLLEGPFNPVDADNGGHPHVDQFILEKWEYSSMWPTACEAPSDTWVSSADQDLHGLPPDPLSGQICEWPPDGNQRTPPDDGGSLHTWTIVLKCGGNPNYRGDIGFEAAFDNVVVIQEGNTYVNEPCSEPGPDPADFEQDLDVDLIDFATLQTCFSNGVGIPSGPPYDCSACDLDSDNDVDQDDLITFINAYTGPNVGQE